MKSRGQSSVRRFRSCAAAVAIAGAAGLACSGAIGDGTSEGDRGEDRGAAPGGPGAGAGSETGVTGGAGATPRPATPACQKGPAPGLTPMRRLNRFEYDNTIRDLIGDSSRPSSLFPPDEKIGGFDNNAEALNVSTLLADQYLAVAEQISERLGDKIATLVPCDVARQGEDACGRAFIDTLGKRAWRRPVSATERTRLLAVLATGRDKDPYASRLQLVLQALLVSPNFLYRAEVGLPAKAGEPAARLTPWETASRLSYLVWASMPDEELFRAADAGQLATKEQIAAQARRLLQDMRARPVVAHFHEQWLELERIETMEKDKKVYPAFTADLRGWLETEARMFLDSVTWDAPGDIASLFTAGHSYMNARLASFYGLKGPAGTGFERVSLNPQQRAGFLTQAGLLATLAKVNQTSPVERGLFVREQLLCDPPPPPPPGLQVKPPDLDPNLTTRERFTQHKENPACLGCHALMDPIGLGFESYDGLGAWRAVENGRPVDASGEIVGTDIAGTFVGAVELGRKLARSQQVSACLRTQWFRFAYGRNVTGEDECSVSTLDAALAAAKGSVRELLIALTQTDTFLYKQIGGAP